MEYQGRNYLMLKELFSNIGPEGKRNLVAAVIANTVRSLISAGILLAVLRMLEGITGGQKDLRSYWLTLIVFLFVKFICNMISSKTSHIGGLELEINLKEKIIRKLKTFSLEFYTNERIGEISTIIQSDVDALEIAVSHFGSKAVGDIITAAVIGVSLFILDWRLALIMVLLLPLAVWVQKTGLGRSLKLREANAKNLADMVSRFVEYTKGMPLLKAFPENQYFHNQLIASTKEFDQSSRDEAKTGAALSAQFYIPLELCFAFVAFAGALLVLGKTVNVDTYVYFIVFSQEFYRPFGDLETYQVNYTRIKDSYGRISKLLKTPVIANPTAPKIPARFDIQFNHVGFRYEHDSFVLKDIDFRVGQGTLTALVGPSGSGKTTIANLLLRFWDTESGVVQIGGIDIRDIPYDELLSKISIVMQNVILFSGTIYENIKMGNKNAVKEQVEEAARQAMIHGEIMELPNGYDTLIGENGSGFSGGQRQRLSIARVLLRNSPIVLLDEITSNVDTLNEIAIQKAIGNLAKDRTVLVIAHHLQTIRRADQIIVFSAGAIVERGTHDELLKNRGVYHTLWIAQEQAKGWKI
jgi:ATP-binding cassette subfamily B protein